MESKWWFASDSFVNGFSELKSTTSAGSEDRDFLDAQKITITVEQAWILDSNDGWGKKTNDLIITTKHLVGGKQPVDKIHFYKANFPSKEFVGTTFHPVIYATNDFRPDMQYLALQVRAYDEDGLNDEQKKGIQTAITTAASASAIAFPAFAPFAGLTAGVGTALVNLIDNLDDHDPIIDTKIRLYVNKPENKGYDLLQPGFIVCFSDDVDGSSLYLGEDKRLYLTPESAAEKYIGSSYVVIRIDRAFLQDLEYSIDEKAATLLSEIESGKDKSGSETLYFVRDTLKAYNNFKRLQRYRQIKDKGAAITKDESDLLAEIENDPVLSPYLP